ncbi:MAG: NYN domain-containing protein [Leptolyngbyaceae cyanobacterium bins.302]|nr:NYN domain-containing protein [Leptolyngbyaceae cyanobacterium bins.302]
MSRSTPVAVLLVDGYNVVGTWHDLKKIRDTEGLEEARRVLTESLINYSAYQGYDTRIVFDAQYRDCPSNREVITSYLSVCYTDFGQTADTYIEKACSAFRNDLRKFHSRLIVATNDRAQQLTVVGYGAECMSAEQLAAEVDTTALQVRQKRKPAKKQTGRFLAHSLDPVAQKRLSEWRFGK